MQFSIALDKNLMSEHYHDLQNVEVVVYAQIDKIHAPETPAIHTIKAFLCTTDLTNNKTAIAGFNGSCIQAKNKNGEYCSDVDIEDACENVNTHIDLYLKSLTRSLDLKDLYSLNTHEKTITLVQS